MKWIRCPFFKLKKAEMSPYKLLKIRTSFILFGNSKKFEFLIWINPRNSFFFFYQNNQGFAEHYFHLFAFLILRFWFLTYPNNISLSFKNHKKLCWLLFFPCSIKPWKQKWKRIVGSINLSALKVDVSLKAQRG
jgi:hypothetical protein